MAAILASAFVGTGPADARKKKQPAQRAQATVDSAPPARLRGFPADVEFAPLEFARWLRGQPHIMAMIGETGLYRVSMSTRLLNRTSDTFRQADADGNGRVSAEEIATLIARRSQPASV